MKASVALIVLMVTINAFALPEGRYEGTNKGQWCQIEISSAYTATYGDFDCYYDEVKEEGNKLLMNGYNEVERCKAEVTLDSNGAPTAYKLKVRNLLSPIYISKGTCKNLVKK